MADSDLIFSQPPASGTPAHLVFGESGAVVLRPTDLVFSRPPITGTPVHLVFGETDAPAPIVPDVTLHGAGQITGLRMRVALHAGTVLQGAGSITGLRMRVAVVYDVAVSRPTTTQAAARYQEAQPVQTGTQACYQQAQPASSGTAARWQDAQATSAAVHALWQDCERLATWARSRWQDAAGLPTAPVRSSYQEAQRTRTGAAAHWQDATRLPVPPVLALYQEMLHLRLGGGARYQEAAPLRASAISHMGIAVPVFYSAGGRYQEAWPPRPGRSTILPPQPPVPEPCYLPSTHLVFKAPWPASAHLVFVCERAAPPLPVGTVVVPVRRVYMTTNSLTLTRVSDGATIHAYSFGMSLDVDSWTWSWQATLHATALPLIQPGLSGDPVEVLATVNGTPYRLCVEQYGRQREFGSTRISVRGLGRAAILDAPYAPTLNHGNTAARTAQQLMADVLTINGVGIGWDVAWGLTDWLVPGNVWAHQGSYISALLEIAAAAGGYVQPHDTAATLRVLPRYPAAPWQWHTLTPDFELPSAVVSVEGTDWQRKAAYNRVHVTGTTAGVLGEVTRGGTAGNIIAPMVTDSLITHADAARQRGLAVLSDTGTQAHISLRLPVLDATGVIKPGALVRYVDGATTHLGLVRATSLEWGAPKLRQVLTVETHPA